MLSHKFVPGVNASFPMGRPSGLQVTFQSQAQTPASRRGGLWNPEGSSFSSSPEHFTQSLPTFLLREKAPIPFSPWISQSFSCCLLGIRAGNQAQGELEGCQGEAAQKSRTGEVTCPCLGGVGLCEASRFPPFLAPLLFTLNPVF